MADTPEPPDPPYMTMTEAYTVLVNHKFVMKPAIRKIVEILNMPNTSSSNYKVRKQLLSTISQRKEARRRGKLAEWEPKVFLPVAPMDINNNDPDYIPSPPRRMHGRPKAPMTSDLSRKSLNDRVNAVLPPLQAIAEAENTTLPELLLSVLVKICRGLGLANLTKLLYSIFVCWSPSMTDIDQPNSISMEKSTYMMISQELGRTRYRDLRDTLLSEGVEAQPWHKVNEHCEAITPARLAVTIDPAEGICGYRYSFEEMCRLSVYRAILAANVPLDSVPDRMFIGGKDGADGSGQHFRRATVNVAVKGNILLYSYTPLLLCAGDDAQGKVLWRNPAPNSALTQRPLAVIGAKEDRDDILRPLIPQIEADILNISQNGFNMDFKGKEIHVSVYSDLSMFDGKMHAALQGTGGAFCQMCKFSKTYCHCIANALNGFPINRSIDDTHNIYRTLTEDGTVPVSRRPDDYDTRAGVTAEPITHRELNSSLSMTHAWINCCRWFLYILYHLAANDLTWGFGNKADPRYKKLMRAKEKVLDTLATVLGRRIDVADASGHTGTSLTGPLARRFFSKACRNVLHKIVKEPHLTFIINLHIHIEVILRVISSKGHRIDVDIFRNLCITTYVNILTQFKWVDLTPTVHKILAHAGELICNNMCMGIGHLSEEGLEASHKIIRRIRASWTLQTNDMANLKDLIKKLWLISDPLFYSFRKVLKCSKCKETGHQRKCPTTEENANQSASDIILSDIFID